MALSKSFKCSYNTFPYSIKIPNWIITNNKSHTFKPAINKVFSLFWHNFKRKKSIKMSFDKTAFWAVILYVDFYEEKSQNKFWFRVLNSSVDFVLKYIISKCSNKLTNLFKKRKRRNLTLTSTCNFTLIHCYLNLYRLEVTNKKKEK